MPEYLSETTVAEMEDVLASSAIATPRRQGRGWRKRLVARPTAQDRYVVVRDANVRFDVVCRLVEPGEPYGSWREETASERLLAFYLRYDALNMRPLQQDPLGHYQESCRLDLVLAADDVGEVRTLSGGLSAVISPNVLAQVRTWLEQEHGLVALHLIRVAPSSRRRPSMLAERLEAAASATDMVPYPPRHGRI